MRFSFAHHAFVASLGLFAITLGAGEPASANSLVILVDASDSPGGNFGYIDNLAFDGTAVAFRGVGSGFDGIYSSDGTALSVVADTNTLIPGTGRTFGLGQNLGVAIHGGVVTFGGRGTYLQEDIDTQIPPPGGVYAWSASTQLRAVIDSSSMDAVTDELESHNSYWGQVSADASGNVAFLSQEYVRPDGEPPFTQVRVQRVQNGVLTRIIDHLDLLPDSLWDGSIQASGDDVVFATGSGIYLGSPGGYTTLVDKSSRTPAGNDFQAFAGNSAGDFAYADGSLAFWAYSAEGPGLYWRDAFGSISTIADATDGFNRFGPYVARDGDRVAFTARRTGTSTWGVYLASRDASGVTTIEHEFSAADTVAELGEALLSAKPAIGGLRGDSVVLSGYSNSRGWGVYQVTFETNTEPVADAGGNQSAPAGVLVCLDGGASWDLEDLDNLAFAWSIVSVPSGSGVPIGASALTGANTDLACFHTDFAGSFVVNLTVRDSKGATASDTVIVSSLNTPPNADAGTDIGELMGSLVQLDGSNSFDPDGDRLTFQWLLIESPAGSTSSIVGGTTAMPQFVPGAPGSYILRLTVSDPYGGSDVDEIQVVVPTASFASNFIVIALGQINDLLQNDPIDFNNNGGRSSMTAHLNNTLKKLGTSPDVANALMQLGKAIENTDGCGCRGRVDGKDTISTCSDQARIFSLLDLALLTLSDSRWSQPPNNCGN